MEITNDNIDGWKVNHEIVKTSQKFNIPTKVIKEWKSIDKLIDAYKNHVLKQNMRNDEIQINLIIEYIIYNHSGLVLYLLKKNELSMYDIHILQYASSKKYGITKQILQLYNDRKTLNEI